MSKNIEIPNKIEKIPTSKLVFYIQNPKVENSNLKIRMEEILFKRLTTTYKLHPHTAQKLVDREKEIIETRGFDLDKYAFGQPLPYEELMKIFYDNVNFKENEIDNNISNSMLDIIRLCLIRTRALESNTLTMSEIAEYLICFNGYKVRFTKRVKKLEKALIILEKTQKKVLTNKRLSFDAKKKEIEKLEEKTDNYDTQKFNEKFLINYNEFVTDVLNREIGILMNYAGWDKKEELKGILIAIRESVLMISKSPIHKRERALYKDIDFDAYSHYVEGITKEFPGYQFTKKDNKEM